MALGHAQLFPALNWQPQFTVIATLSTIFVIVKKNYSTVLEFAEVRPDHPQPTKTTEVCLVRQK